MVHDVHRPQKHLRSTLRKVSKGVISQATADHMSDPFEMSIEMEEYGHYQDQGVNGVGPAGKDKNGNVEERCSGFWIEETECLYTER